MLHAASYLPTYCTLPALCVSGTASYRIQLQLAGHNTNHHLFGHPSLVRSSSASTSPELVGFLFSTWLALSLYFYSFLSCFESRLLRLALQNPELQHERTLACLSSQQTNLASHPRPRAPSTQRRSPHVRTLPPRRR